jgi:hypothetical protein
MESFYKDWLKKNSEENKRAINQLQEQNESTNISIENPTRQSSPSIYDNPIPSTSRGLDTEPHPAVPTDNLPNLPRIHNTVSDIVYQKDGLQLLVEKAMFQRQKKFSLQVRK